MDLLGNILKGTTKVGYMRQVKKSQKLKDQNHTLQKLLTRARLTDFGMAHNFTDVLASEQPSKAFREVVPLTNYEQFHAKWLRQALEDKRNITWPGRIPFYALSSGTTNSPSKRIPVSDNMLRQFQRVTIQQIVGIHKLDLPSAFFETQVLIIGGSTELEKVGAHYEGDLSGILAKNKSFILSPFSKPGRRISRIRDWKEKMDEIVKKADQWDIGIIAGVPSWITLLLESIIEYYNVESIHDVWPNFSLYSHGGIFIDPYKERLNKLFAKPVYFQNTYLASEGYFGFQRDFEQDGMELLLSNGIYFEFVEEHHFEKIKEGDFSEIGTLNIDEVEQNVPYGLVISTCSGLWRYVIGDVVEFTDLETKRINIVGRISFGLSIVGEHLSDGNMLDAIKKVSAALGVIVEEFCVHPNSTMNGHHWYIGLQQPDAIDGEQFAALLDKEIKANNDDYASIRKSLLLPPTVLPLSVDTFYGFMERRGKIGGQNKFPRVLKEGQIEEWKVFVAR